MILFTTGRSKKNKGAFDLSFELLSLGATLFSFFPSIFPCSEPKNLRKRAPIKEVFPPISCRAGVCVDVRN